VRSRRHAWAFVLALYALLVATVCGDEGALPTEIGEIEEETVQAEDSYDVILLMRRSCGVTGAYHSFHFPAMRMPTRWG